MPVNLPPLCLGGNVLGWTADEAASFAVLDAARAGGITFVDSADTYSSWAHDGVGGQSETVLGRWMADRGARDETLVATKVGMHPGLDDLRPGTVRTAFAASLERLGTDTVDLFYAHQDDGGDLAEAWRAFDALARDGSARMLGVSNFAPARLRELLAICTRDGLTPPVVLQPPYSLVDRDFEDELQDAAAEADLAVVPYSALASGFLTGKYRPGGPEVDSPRSGGARAHLDSPRGPAVLAALDAAADAHAVPVAAVALAWLRAQPTVTSPIASARSVDQVAPLVASLDLALTADELAALDDASRLPAAA